MPWWTTLCVALLGLSLLVTGMLVTFALLRLLRGLRAAIRAVEYNSALLTARLETMNARLAAAGDSGTRVSVSHARLDGSLEDLRTLSWAFEDVRRLLRLASSAYPRG
jgi:hypothetical protein